MLASFQNVTDALVSLNLTALLPLHSHKIIYADRPGLRSIVGKSFQNEPKNWRLDSRSGGWNWLMAAFLSWPRKGEAAWGDARESNW